MLENSKIVYVAHPYGGLSSNYDKASDIMRVLCDKFSDKTFVSPYSWRMGLCMNQ